MAGLGILECDNSPHPTCKKGCALGLISYYLGTWQCRITPAECSRPLSGDCRLLWFVLLASKCKTHKSQLGKKGKSLVAPPCLETPALSECFLALFCFSSSA